MSSDSDKDNSGRGLTPNCPIPSAATGREETQPDCGKSVVAVSVMSSSEFCPVVYGSVSSSIRSKSYRYIPPRTEATDQNENAADYPRLLTTPPLISSYGNAEKDAQLPSSDVSNDDKLTISVQETDPNATSECVPSEMPTVKASDYVLEAVDGQPLLSGYWNLHIEKIKETTEDSLNEASEDALDNADPTTVAPNYDDTLPFQMDDDLDHVTESTPGAPGTFATSLSLSQSRERNERPPRSEPITANRASDTALSGSQTNKSRSRSNTSTPTKCSPSTLSSSNKSSSSTQSESAVVATGHNNQIVKSYKRATLCNSISRLTSKTEFDLGQWKMNGTKAKFQFHAQGLDQDSVNHNGTVTATFQFPDRSKKPQEMDIMECEFKLSVNVYRGSIKENHIIGQSSSVGRLDEDDRKRKTLHMTVHNVVSLKNIIFSASSVDKISIEVVVEFATRTSK